MTYVTTGPIINERGPKPNPHEMHDFEYKVKYMDDELIEEHISWSLSGNVPKKLTIDDNGVIKGRIDILEHQDIPANMFSHKEKLKRDGSNWKKNGRFKGVSYTFNFTITRKYTIIDEEAEEPEPILITASADVSLIIIKNHNVDNLIYMDMYFDAGYTTKRNNRIYDKDTRDEFLATHPGPFK